MKRATGFHLDERTHWPGVADLLEDAYRRVAPKRLLSRLDER